jgi:LPS export ABC transporter protein LptC
MTRQIAAILSLLTVACDPSASTEPLIYDGPLSEAVHVTLYYTEHNLLKVKMTAPRILEFQNGDREFPEGIYLEFYDELGALSSTLRANTARYFKEQDQWQGRGNVTVVNLQQHQQLDTEELYWKPDTEKIFTDSFVTIKLESEVIYGKGLDAKQDLSSYTIRKPEGEFILRE